ncbi:helix-turn-helix domain-containing protein [Candidatus Falkowbacteria bacterium]|nr:helix-turn-helix domain-containing protein [Candidatus Falkowbacteria bacterium]
MGNVLRVSVSEASRLFGVDQKTIRRALKAEELKYIVVQGRYKVNFESLLEWSQGRLTTKNKLQKQGIGQYVDKWKIKNKLYSPHPKLAGLDSRDQVKREIKR